MDVAVAGIAPWLPSPSQHFLCGAVALLVYSLTTRTGQLRRPPAAAIAWVMGLVLFPYGILPLYLIFGRRKMKLRHVKRARPRDAWTDWAPTLIQTFGFPAPARARVRFHADGAEARDALWEIIERAERSLDVCTFIVGDDAIGRELLARLAARARAGVKVRLLIDGAGRWLTRQPSYEVLRSAGGQVRVFHPLFSLHPYGPRNLRNHRKLVVADGQWLWSGGRNFAAAYFCGQPGSEKPWIDLSFDLQGTVVGAAARQFSLDWDGDADVDSLEAEPPAEGAGTLTQYVSSGPDQPEDTVQALLLAACVRAQSRFLAVSPYFVPDESLLAALRLAALRGVRVTLVLPASSNHPLADFVRTRALRALASAGADIRLVPQMVHAKAVIIDDSLALSGSVNLDARSLLINYEAEFAFYEAADIQWLSQWVEALAERGTPFVLRAPSLLRDVAEGLLLTVAFQL